MRSVNAATPQLLLERYNDAMDRGEEGLDVRLKVFDGAAERWVEDKKPYVMTKVESVEDVMRHLQGFFTQKIAACYTELLSEVHSKDAEGVDRLIDSLRPGIADGVRRWYKGLGGVVYLHKLTASIEDYMDERPSAELMRAGVSDDPKLRATGLTGPSGNPLGKLLWGVLLKGLHVERGRGHAASWVADALTQVDYETGFFPEEEGSRGADRGHADPLDGDQDLELGETSSGYKGVHWMENSKGWMISFRWGHGNHKLLGPYDSALEAARARHGVELEMAKAPDKDALANRLLSDNLQRNLLRKLQRDSGKSSQCEYCQKECDSLPKLAQHTGRHTVCGKAKAKAEKAKAKKAEKPKARGGRERREGGSCAR